MSGPEKSCILRALHRKEKPTTHPVRWRLESLLDRSCILLALTDKDVLRNTLGKVLSLVIDGDSSGIRTIRSCLL